MHPIKIYLNIIFGTNKSKCKENQTEYGHFEQGVNKKESNHFYYITNRLVRSFYTCLF